MRKISFLLLVMIFIILTGCSSQSTNPIVTPSLSTDNGMNPFERVVSSESGVNQAYWSDLFFVEGEYWIGRRNNNGTVHRAFGKGIPAGSDCVQIIDSHPELFTVSSDRLLQIEEYTEDGIRYVFFRQIINGVQIKDSRVELRFARNGNLMLIGADVFPDLNIYTAASVDSPRAIQIASSDSDSPARIKELVIEKREYSEFHLVWQVISGDFTYHIDAHSGLILEKESNLLENHSWTVEAEVYELSPFSPVLSLPYPNLLNRVNIPDIGLTDYYANLYGYTGVESGEESLPVETFFDSQWVNLIACDGGFTEGKIAWNSENELEQTPLFDDTNSRMGERMVGYWANVSHNYIKNYAPTYEGMDFPLDTNADCCCTCNAFAHIEAPLWIKMYQAYGDCVATSEVADITIHEYGHIYVAVQYTLGRPPLTIHEGFADYLANTITDQPEIGKDIRGEGTNFRSSVNGVLYDTNNCGGESHCVGNIIAGALWEIRSVLGASYVDNLWHQARFAQSQTFEGFVVDFYMVDDDDDNVLNGTPNAAIFTEAYWDNHHIPVPSMPDIPTEGVTLDLVPTEFPLEMDRMIGNNLWFNAKLKNLNLEPATFDIWTSVELPSDVWYGPMIPASVEIRNPITITLQPDEEIEFTVRQAIPFNLPAGTYRYHGRIGEFVDHENDILLDDGWIDFVLF